MKGKAKKKIPWQRLLVTGLYMALGAVCGALMVPLVVEMDAEASLWQRIVPFFALLALLYAAFFVQVILHEAGHLVFGLLTGYRFCSFRILSLTLVRSDGAIRLKRFSLAGTGGQCLMDPPEPQDGRMNVLLYNLGGSLMNLATAAAFWGLHFAVRSPLPRAFLLMLAACGVVIGLVNGIPLRLGAVDNDGYNAFALRRDPEATRAFYIQLKVNALQTEKGMRLKDMPPAWFSVPSSEAMKNSLAAAVGALACSRLMDEHRFAEADNLTASLLSSCGSLNELLRTMMLCDRAYCALIGACRGGALERMMSDAQKKLARAMKNYPSVLRTAYAAALLKEGDPAKAAAIRQRFERVAARYPFEGEIRSERELMEIAERAAQGKPD